MIFKVEQHWEPGMERLVHVPNEEVTSSHEKLLELIFYYGQNDFQPVKNRPSLSVGDIVHIEDCRYRCEPVGWKLL
jgi:hypothetical protein